MGFPLSMCMHGVGWPQNRCEPPSALFRPEPVQVEGCHACNKVLNRCRCVIKADGLVCVTERGPESYAMKRENTFGFPDEEGTLWPYFTQSMEDGYNGETYLIRHWSDEYDEWSLATALNGEVVAGQLRSLRSETIRFWRPVDPVCFCIHLMKSPDHDAWESCNMELPAISDEEFPE